MAAISFSRYPRSAARCHAPLFCFRKSSRYCSSVSSMPIVASTSRVASRYRNSVSTSTPSLSHRIALIAGIGSARELAEYLLDPGDALADFVQVGADLQPVRSGELVMLVLVDELHHASGIDRRIGDELQLHAGFGRVDARDPEWLAEHAQAMAFEQRFRVRRRQAETVDELFVHRVERFLGLAI